MNKILHYYLLFSITILAFSSVDAQSFGFLKTDYVGALSADPAADWTQKWTNFDPKNTAYPAPTDLTTLDGTATSLPVPGELNITNTLTLDASKVYQLKGLIVVRSGGRLVIPAGTIIRAQADLSTTPKNYATIVVERGGQIEVNGTSEKPVVITSAKAPGARERGDWGGLLIAGRAPHNLLDATTNNVQMEGFNNISFDPTLARFGGNDPLDNSGVIRYLRLEFSGFAFEANREINGLTMGGVGRGTVIDYVQVSFCGDDAFEWFGGTVNTRHLISYKNTDDDFDTDNGYSGLNQFGIALRDSTYFDLTWNAPSGSSTSEGFESDNEATGTANVKPGTNAVFANYTMLGPIPVGTTYAQASSLTRSAFRRGARIRRNSSLRICNSIFMGYRNFVMMDGDSSIRNTNWPAALNTVKPSTEVDQKSKQTFFSNNLIVSTASAYTSTTDTTANGLAEVARTAGSKNRLNAIDAWLRQTGPLANKINPVAFTTGTVLVNPLASSTTPDFKPVGGSPALSGAEWNQNPILKDLISSSKEIELAEKFAPIYPNPMSRGGQLNFGRVVDAFGIFDIKGGLVQWGVSTDHVVLENLAPGMYFIKMDGQMQKLIVQ